MKGTSINRELYKNEKCGLLHLNEKRARIAIETINSALVKLGLKEIIEDFRMGSLSHQRR